MRQGRAFRFGAFELDLDGRELRRSGLRVRLPGKPFAVLSVLVERAGEVASREELQRRVWPDTHVDLERALNNAVNRLRITLADSARSPRYVETVPGRGYRFVAPVERIAPAAPRLRASRWVTAAVVLMLAMAASGLRRPASSHLHRSPGRQAYWAGLHLYERRGPTALPEAYRSFAEAVRRDPDLAPAYARLAMVALDMAYLHLGPGDSLAAEAEEAARRALALDPDLADAHVAQALVRAWVESRWADAEAELQAAVQLEPESAVAFRARASILAAQGRLDEAIQAGERAAALDPLFALSYVYAGRLHYYARRYDEAIDRLHLALAMEPDHPFAQKALSDVYWKKGRHREAEGALLAWLAALSVGAQERERVERALRSGGMVGLWQENVRRVEAGRGDGPGVPFKVATFYASLGDADRTVEWLRRALDQRDRQLLYVPLDPVFDGVRRSPRFPELVAAIEEAFRLRRS